MQLSIGETAKNINCYKKRCYDSNTKIADDTFLNDHK